MGGTLLKKRTFWLLIGLAMAVPGQSFSQCVGGFFAGTISPLTAWQAIGCAWAGDYYEFNATNGIPYTFTLCQAPGYTPFNSQLTILDNFGTPVAGGYNDNACVGGGSHIQSWIAPATGTYRILINENICAINTTCCDLAFKQERPIGAGTTCSNPYVVPSLPLTLNNMATCGYGNDYTASTSACPSSYMDGEDFIFEYTTTGPECIDIRTSNTFTWTGILVYDGCPDAPSTNCMGGSVSGTGSPQLTNFNLPSAGTYYFVISTWPPPPCTPFDVFIDNCPVPGPGLSCSNPRPISSLPYSQQYLTTCAHGDDYNPTDTCTTPYMGGEDFTFTYTATGPECINIALSNTSTWVGIAVTDDCPNAVGATCLASAGNSGGNTRLRDVMIPAAGTYYITVSTWPNPQCTPFDIEVFNCPPDCGRNAPAGDACSGATNVTGQDTVCGTSEAYYNIDTAGTNLTSEFCGSLDNEAWFAFTADTTDIDIDFITIENCIYQFGLQAQVFSTPNCQTFTSVSNCWNPQSTSPGTLNLTGLTVGQTYYLMIDGWAGDICDYEFVINGATTILPVEMGEIFLNVEGASVELVWETMNESQNKGFYIQRGRTFESSEKFAVNWEEIGFVQGMGTTNDLTQYSYKDLVEFNGEPMYYRLRQVDFDGMSAFSEVVVANPGAPQRDALVSVYPNPAQNTVSIDYLIGAEKKATTFTLFTLTGEQVLETRLNGGSTGYYTDEVSLDGIKNGLYIYRLNIGGASFPGKLTVIH